MPITHSLAAASLLAASTAASAQDAFTIIALPDTQNYVTSASNTLNFNTQTQWIADEIQLFGNPRNISFVTHLGDMVSNGDNLTEMTRADAAMDTLDGAIPDRVVPYGVLPGNHDFADTGVKSTGTALFRQFFGPQRFDGTTWFGGSDPSGNNTFQLFDGGGQTYLHIALEWRPDLNVTNGPERDPSPLEWAQQVMLDHPGIPTIISSHEHLDDDPAGRSASGENVWNTLVRRNDQVIMVLNGHYHSVGGTNDGEYHQLSTNDFGKPVVEALQDFQDYPNGGDGWLRIITLDPQNNEIRFETYSPVLDQFQSETIAQVGQFASQFTIPFDFDARFQFEDPPLPPIPPRPIFEDVVIQQGVNGYTGTLDKEIRSSGGDSNNGQNTEISVDGDDGSPGAQPNDALIRFDNIIGAGASQIAPGASIPTALLQLNITNPGSGFDLFQMIQTWDESTTWTDFGGDGITPSVEAAAAPVFRVGADNSGTNVGTGLLQLDVTPIVQAWADGDSNLGFGLAALPSGSNGTDFTSSESGNPPALVIRSTIPIVEPVAFKQGADGYTGAADTELAQSAPTDNRSAAPTFSVDASDGGGQNHVLIRFDGIFGGAPGLVPTDAPIARAFLTVDAFNPGDGAAVHRLLLPFDNTATWASSYGGNGVQPDNTEAVATPDATVIGAATIVDIDVTASIRAWQEDPTSNLGWALLPLGSNGWDFSSSDDLEQFRPVLTVYLDLCPPDLVTPFNGTPDAADIQEFLRFLEQDDPRADWNNDGIADVFDLLDYLRDHNAGCQI